jgi:hypothetical protein
MQTDDEPGMRSIAWRPHWLAALTLLAAIAPASAQRPATTAEADGTGKVAVDIVYFAEEDCIGIADVREGAPASIDGPKRTLVVTVTLMRASGPCEQRFKTIERRISIADRADALSVDIFYVDAGGKFIRSQRPRIYRDKEDERDCSAGASPKSKDPAVKC